MVHGLLSLRESSNSVKFGFKILYSGESSVEEVAGRLAGLMSLKGMCGGTVYVSESSELVMLLLSSGSFQLCNGLL